MYQSLNQRKQQALMRIHSSRVGVIASVEDSCSLLSSWKESLPNAQAVGKLSLGLGVSWVLKRAFEHYVNRRKSVETPLSAKTSFLRYLLLQSCTLVLFPILRKKMMESSYKNFGKNITRPNIDSIFYRWLGLEN